MLKSEGRQLQRSSRVISPHCLRLMTVEHLHAFVKVEGFISEH